MNKKSASKYRYLVRDSLRVVRTALKLRKPMPAEQGRALYGAVGHRDSARAGWYKEDTRELFEGFPIQPSDTVVDVGCGLGGNLSFCARFAKYAIGVDIDPKQVEATANRLKDAGLSNFKTLVSDGNPLPIESGTADKVVCTEVLEHVDDPAQTMRELVRIGKPGALYFLSVPGAASEEVLRPIAPAACFEKPNHIRVFDYDGFETLVSASGLQIEKHALFSFYWALWHAMLWTAAVDYDKGTHPALDHLARAWDELLKLPDGKKCIDELDRVLHKSQIIIARKPLTV